MSRIRCWKRSQVVVHLRDPSLPVLPSSRWVGTLGTNNSRMGNSGKEQALMRSCTLRREGRTSRCRCGNNNSDANNLQEPQHSQDPHASLPLSLRLLFFILDVLYGSFLHTAPLTTTLSPFIPTSSSRLLLRMRFALQTIANLPHCLFSERSLIPLLSTCYKVSPVPISLSLFLPFPSLIHSTNSGHSFFLFYFILSFDLRYAVI